MTDVVDILLVDDEERNLTTLEVILDDPGYRLLRAYDADGALKTLLKHDVAAIVLDIKMPVMSGFELAKMIRATRRYRHIPIVFLTAYMLDEKDMITGYSTGAVEYLTKPVSPVIVRHKVAVFAELFRKTRALAHLNDQLEARVAERTAELQKSEEALRLADRQKDEFIAVLAHELRNPLAPLRFGLDVLAKSQQSPSPRVAKTITTMDRQLNHMVRLIDDLLDISRVRSGRIDLKKLEVDLASIVQMALEMSRPFLEKHDHSVSIELAKDLFAYGDSTRLTQIVGNLLHNAAKFTPDGGRITITLTREGSDAVFRVKDSGEGIAAEQLERVFDMFAHIDRAGWRAERGLGIGLTLGRRLAEMHDGTLTVASDGVGHGSTFSLRLPAISTNGSSKAEARAEIAVGQVAPLDIVLIEDTDDVAETLEACLREMGHRVSVARNGKEGLALVEQHAPSVVLCDLLLPEMDGFEICRRVRRLPLSRQPRMIALTGWGRDEDRRRTSEAGFDAHLVKPVAVDSLMRTLAGE